MNKKLVSFLIISVLLYSLAGIPAQAGTETYGQTSREQKVKAGIYKLGVGRDARVTVKLQDHRKLAGYVSNAGENHFVLTDLKTGESTPVAYSAVTQVKGNNLSTGAKIAIGIGIGVGATLLVLYLIFRSFD